MDHGDVFTLSISWTTWSPPSLFGSPMPPHSHKLLPHPFIRQVIFSNNCIKCTYFTAAVSIYCLLYSHICSRYHLLTLSKAYPSWLCMNSLTSQFWSKERQKCASLTPNTVLKGWITGWCVWLCGSLECYTMNSCLKDCLIVRVRTRAETPWRKGSHSIPLYMVEWLSSPDEMCSC